MALIRADLMRLKSTLLTSGIQHKNPALFQVIDQLINFIKDLEEDDELSTTPSSGGSSGSLGSVVMLDFGDRSGGGDEGIMFPPGGSATATGAGDFIWVPLTDGDALEPSDIFDSFGNHIMVQEFFP